MEKLKKLLFNHCTISYIFVFAFWSRILFSVIANSVDDGASYQTADAFEPSAIEQGLPTADGGGTGESEGSLSGN